MPRKSIIDAIPKEPIRASRRSRNVPRRQGEQILEDPGLPQRSLQKGKFH